jgi:hypothetical protein
VLPEGQVLVPEAALVAPSLKFEKLLLLKMCMQLSRQR